MTDENNNPDPVATPIRVSDLPLDSSGEKGNSIIAGSTTTQGEIEPQTVPEASAQSGAVATPLATEPLLGSPIVATPEDLMPTDDKPKKRGRGRPPGSANKNKDGSEESASVIVETQPAPISPITVEQIPQVDYALMSQMAFDAGTNSLAMLFGPEWQARDETERSAVCNSLASYLRAKQVQDIPPGMMLTIVLCAYSAPRLRQPATANKLKLGWYWLKNKFSKKVTVAV